MMLEEAFHRLYYSQDCSRALEICSLSGRMLALITLTREVSSEIRREFETDMDI